jgi:hypothetical protein
VLRVICYAIFGFWVFGLVSTISDALSHSLGYIGDDIGGLVVVAVITVACGFAAAAVEARALSRSAEPLADRIPTRYRLANAFYTCASAALICLSIVGQALNGEVLLYFVIILGAVTAATYLCAVLLNPPDWLLRARHHREPSGIKPDEPGIAASKPHTASGRGSADVSEDRPSHDAAVIPDDAPAGRQHPAWTAPLPDARTVPEDGHGPGPRQRRVATRWIAATGLTVVGLIAWFVLARPFGGSGTGHASVGSGTAHSPVGSSTRGWVLAPPPAGCAPSTTPLHVNGPMDASVFNDYMSETGAQGIFGFVDGYEQTYVCDSSSDSVDVALVKLESSDRTGQLIGALTWFRDGRTSDYPGIPGAVEVDAPREQGTPYEHEIVAAKGARVMIIDGWTASPRLPTPFHQLVDRQYASLKP